MCKLPVNIQNKKLFQFFCTRDIYIKSCKDGVHGISFSQKMSPFSEFPYKWVNCTTNMTSPAQAPNLKLNDHSYWRKCNTSQHSSIIENSMFQVCIFIIKMNIFFHVCTLEEDWIQSLGEQFYQQANSTKGYVVQVLE